MLNILLQNLENKKLEKIVDNKIKGTVKFHNDTRGFGFIKPDNGDKDVFVHVSKLGSIGGTLHDGQTVMFETTGGREGLEAENIELA